MTVILDIQFNIIIVIIQSFIIVLMIFEFQTDIFIILLFVVMMILPNYLCHTGEVVDWMTQFFVASTTGPTIIYENNLAYINVSNACHPTNRIWHIDTPDFKILDLEKIRSCQK